MFRIIGSTTIVLATTVAHAQDGIPLGRFVDVRPVAGLELGGFEDQSPHVSGDGLTMHFASNRGTQRRFRGKSVFVATRDSAFDSFGTPVPVDEPLNHADERRDRLISFDFSSDNRTVVFTTTRNERRDTDLVMSTRDDPKDPWGDLIDLGDEINSTADDWGPSLSADGRSLYFSSFRNGDSDVFVATRDSDDGRFGPAQPLVVGLLVFALAPARIRRDRLSTTSG